MLPGQLNKEFINISRVVIHPKFRSIGLGANLVRESLTLVSKKYVETTAVMAKFNPFFEKAGMKRVPSEPDSTNVYKNQIKDLENMGVSLSNLSEIGSISSDQYLRICEYLSKSENYFSLTALYAGARSRSGSRGSSPSSSSSGTAPTSGGFSPGRRSALSVGRGRQGAGDKP